MTNDQYDKIAAAIAAQSQSDSALAKRISSLEASLNPTPVKKQVVRLVIDMAVQAVATVLSKALFKKRP